MRFCFYNMQNVKKVEKNCIAWKRSLYGIVKIGKQTKYRSTCKDFFLLCLFLAFLLPPKAYRHHIPLGVSPAENSSVSYSF